MKFNDEFTEIYFDFPFTDEKNDNENLIKDSLTFKKNNSINKTNI